MVDVKIQKSKVQRDWKTIVSKSDGAQVFVPEKLIPAVKKWAQMRDEFNSLINSIAKAEVEVGVQFQNLILDMRKYFADAGQKDIWIKDVGIETEALKEGVYVLNISDDKRSQLPPAGRS